MLIKNQSRILLSFCFRRRGKTAGFVVLGFVISFCVVLGYVYGLPLIEFTQRNLGSNNDGDVFTWTAVKRNPTSQDGMFFASVKTQSRGVSDSTSEKRGKGNEKSLTIYEKLKTVAQTAFQRLKSTAGAVSVAENTTVVIKTPNVAVSSSSRTNSLVITTTKTKQDCDDLVFHTEDEELQLFKPGVSGKQFCTFIDLVKTLTEALDQANITYFLYGGTLIGSWRHHAMVPWDDDVDIIVDFTRQRDLRQVLNRLEPNYHYVVRPTVSWKFYSEDANQIFPFSWSWPFIDICFFNDNGTHVSEHDLKSFPEFIFPREWIFPLTRRPYNGMLLSCPRDTQKVLEHTYKLSDCAIGRHSHKRERSKPDEEVTIVDCEALRPLYPFVERVSLGMDRGCNETLVVNGTVISWNVLENLRC